MVDRDDPGSGADRDPVEKLAESFIERHRRGERPQISEYAEKHPELAGRIRELFPALVMVEQIGSAEVDGARAPPAAADAVRELGDFTILRRIGGGGMGVVYEARQESLGRHVALKVLPGHALLSESHLVRFRREAQAAAHLHHTNIVPVYAVGEHEGLHYYAMQLIQGQNLEKVIEELRQLREAEASRAAGPEASGAAPPRAGSDDGIAERLRSGAFECDEGAGASRAHSAADAPAPKSGSSTTALLDGEGGIGSSASARYFHGVARLGIQAANALAYAHGEGVLHRDIKPSNLLLDAKGVLWITDFGLAKTEDSGALTRTGDVVGTLAYMPPERFDGWSDPRSDIYSLGLTLYELLTLTRAFDAPDRNRLMRKVAEERPLPPRAIDPRIPRDLETIVLKAIEKQPAQRYATAAQMEADLRSFLEGRPIQARRNRAAERAWLWCRRNPIYATMSASIFVLLLTIAIGATLSAVHLRHERNTSLEYLRKARTAEATAEAAKTETMRKLWDSYLAQARAARWSARSGRRFDSIEALARARALAPALGLGAAEMLETRNEAIACLALADLRIDKTWPKLGRWRAVFDRTFELCADGDRQGTVHIRRTADLAPVAELPGLGFDCEVIAMRPDGAYLAVRHRTTPDSLWVWDLRKRAVVLKSPIAGNGNPADFSPRGDVIALGLQDGTIRLHDLAAGRDLEPPAKGPVANRIAFHPVDEKLLLGSSESRTVRLIDLDAGGSEVLFEHEREVLRLAWHPGGTQFASGCRGCKAYVWDAADNQAPRAVLAGHHAEVAGVSFSATGNVLATSSWDGSTILWNPSTGRPQLTAAGRSEEFSPDGRFLYFFAGTHTRGLWQVAEGLECRTLKVHHAAGKGCCDWAISPDQRLLVVPCTDGVRIVNFRTLEHAAFMAIGCTWAVAFDPRTGHLVTSGDRGIHAWPLNTGPDGDLRLGPPEPRAHLALTKHMAMSRDGRHTAVSQGGTVYVISEDARINDISLPAGASPIGLTISPGGDLIAHGNWKGDDIRVWNVRMQRVEQRFPGYTGHACFSPDGRWLATATGQEYLLLDAGSWTQRWRREREGAGNLPGGMAFSSDGGLLALAPAPGRILIVRPDTGEEICSLQAPESFLFPKLRFCAQGRYLIAADESHSIQIWDLPRIRAQLRALGLDWDETAPDGGGAAESARKKVDNRPGMRMR